MLAVATGMFLGQEGPMVTMGATVGRAVSGMSNKALGLELPFFARLRNPKDRRDFVAAGAGAGVAAAFASPVGGLLFSMEEVASFWSHIMTWQVFFCCMVASITTNVLKAADVGQGGMMGGFVFEVRICAACHLFHPIPLSLTNFLLS
jgi:chloride channel 7